MLACRKLALFVRALVKFGRRRAAASTGAWPARGGPGLVGCLVGVVLGLLGLLGLVGCALDTCILDPALERRQVDGERAQATETIGEHVGLERGELGDVRRGDRLVG